MVTNDEICWMCHQSSKCTECCNKCKDSCNAKQVCGQNEKDQDERLEALKNLIYKEKTIKETIMPEQTIEKIKSYLQTRVYEELGVTEELNKISLKSNHHVPYTTNIFTSDKDDNIRILVYTLDRFAVQYPHPKATPEKPNIFNDRDLTYYITRLKNPAQLPNGDVKKYNIPKGAGTYPFITPGIIDKFEKKEKIKTLVLTEGYFKAFKGFIHGLDIIGLSSITHYKEKETQQIYEAIRKVIITCSVENVIMLYDGDCRDISQKALDNGDDLYKRPITFFSSAKAIKELLADYDYLNVYFANVISDSVKGEPKGLDDIYVAMKGREDELTDDLLSFSKKQTYFYKENITYNLSKLQRYFHIKSADDFYEFHADVIKWKDFVYNGTKYQWDESKNEGKGELSVIVPGAAKNYFRVGDHYNEIVKIPNKYSELETAIHMRQKSTIEDDHGKKFMRHVPKYKAFCNVPSHENYQQIIHNCYNMYAPFDYIPEAGECESTLNFLKHIFGPQYEIGLDYIQLLYQQPTQILPILCLISKENETGKTTFAKWLKAVFTQNMTIVGNSELQNNFNSIYASKLIVCCDEAFIDKKVVIERIKSLSTADRIVLNTKNKVESEIEFFGKFILLSNNEDNFIYASNEDIRYWVIKVPVPENKKVRLMNEMVDEIPAFLDYLNKRKMTTECKSRMWFEPKQLETEALRNIIENSKSSLEKELFIKFKNMFLEFGKGEIYLTPQIINEEFCKKRFDESYISKVIKNSFKADHYKNKDGQYCVKTIFFPYWDKDITENEEGREVKMVIKHKRYTGRPYVFYRKDFVTTEEEKIIFELDDVNKQ